LAIDPSGALHAGTQGGGVAELQSISQDRQPIHLPAPGNRETRNLGPR